MIDVYNNHTSLLREEDISYNIDGILTQDEIEYEFPTTRRKDKLSIMEQCHGIMRSKMFSSPIAEYSDSLDETRKMVTLEAILTHVQTNDEWKPLNKFGSSTNAGSRDAIVEAIRSYKENDFALSVLYDSRFVSHDSQFCATDPPHTKPTTRKISLDNLWSVLYEGTLTDYDESDQMSIPKTILELGINARSMGNIDTICPCPYYHEMVMETECAIHVTFCSMSSFVEDSLSLIFEQCNNGVNYITYNKKFIGDVRNLLVEYSDFLYQNNLECHHMIPSDLWGISNTPGQTEIDAIIMSMYAKSGVTLGNLKHVQNTFKTLLGEGNRTVHLNATGDTQVKNVLCREQWNNHSQIARLGFPVLSFIAESPVVVNCLRYIMEISWIDILETYEPLREDSDIYVRELHLRSQTAAVKWHKRCQAKLTKLRSCREQGAYFPSVINNPENANDNLKYCPFKLSADVDYKKTALMSRPCLVIHDKNLYDPHLCIKKNVLEVDNDVNNIHVLEINQIIDECKIFNPIDMLSSNTAGMHGVLDLPDLRQQFVYDILENQTAESTYSARTSGIMYLL